MSADLTTRLRAMSRHEHDDLSIGDEAADRIAELERRNAELLAVLQCARDYVACKLDPSFDARRWQPTVREHLALVDAAIANATRPTAANTGGQDERATFEGWLLSEGWRGAPGQRENGTYINGSVQARWLAWKAARRTAVGAGGQWRPIDTAPRDGTEFILRYPLQGNVKQLASWNMFRGLWQSKGETIFPHHQKCEWAPLPSDGSPAVDAAREGEK